MLDILMKLSLVVLILSLMLGFNFFSPQIISVVIIILILKIFSLENNLNELEQKLDSLSGKKSATQQPQPSTEIKTKPANEYDLFPTEQPTLMSKNSPEPIEETTRLFEEPVTQAAPVDTSSAIDSWVKNLLFTGNPMAKIGVIILFIGMTFFIRYVAEHNLLSIEVRHVLVALAGIVMIGIGSKLAAASKNYANTLSGGGVGLLYLTVYSAFHIYHLLMPVPSFIMLTLVVILTGVLAVLQDAKLLAIFGMLGGFASPILISDGSNNYVFLFSYYLGLNVAVLGLAFFKSWWPLNLLGFIFTFIITALWGCQSYRPDYFSTTEPFLITFFLFYVAITVLYALHHPDKQNRISNTFLIFGNPLIAFSMQAGLVYRYEYGIAISAFALCLFYGLLAGIIYLINSNRLRHLSAAFGGLSLLFGTLTIPYAFSHLWAATDWALESILLLWYSIYQGNAKLRFTSGLVMMASIIMFLFNLSTTPHAAVFFSNDYLSAILIIFALLTSSYLLYKHSTPDESSQSIAQLYILIGIPSWFLLNLAQIQLYVWYDMQYIDMIVFIASTCLVSWLTGAYLNWRWLDYPAIALLPAMIILSLPNSYYLYYHPNGINIAWFYSFAALYTILFLHNELPKKYLPNLHLITFIFLSWFITNRIDLAILNETNWPAYWRLITYGVIPTMILQLTLHGKSLLKWPLAKYEYSYEQAGGLILCCYLTGWIAVSSFCSGDVDRIHYLPLFNPLDTAIMLALATLYSWAQHTHRWLKNSINDYSTQNALGIFSLICFIWLNAVILRSLHHWLDIPYVWEALWNSMAIQATFSIFWSVIALLITTIAARLHSRELWFCGFTLMWIVIIKLFLVDLSDTNTIGRIVTFIGVGVLMLINGYLSPLPPRDNP